MALANAFQQLQIGLAVGVLAALAAALSDGAARAEGARGHRVNQVRGVPSIGTRETFSGTVHAGPTQQTDGVRVGGYLTGPLPSQSPPAYRRIHHQDVVSHTSHNTRSWVIMMVAAPVSSLGLLHNLQHLSLDGHIQCGGGLIGDEHAGSFAIAIAIMMR